MPDSLRNLFEGRVDGRPVLNSEVSGDMVPVVANHSLSFECRGDGPGFCPITHGLSADLQPIGQFANGQELSLVGPRGGLELTHHENNIEAQKGDAASEGCQEPTGYDGSAGDGPIRRLVESPDTRHRAAAVLVSEERMGEPATPDEAGRVG